MIHCLVMDMPYPWYFEYTYIFLICQERDVEMWSNIKCCPLLINTKWSWRPISDSLWNIMLQKIFKNKSKFYYTSRIEFFIYANLILDQTFYRKNLLHFHLSHNVKNEKCRSFSFIVLYLKFKNNNNTKFVDVPYL